MIYTPESRYYFGDLNCGITPEQIVACQPTCVKTIEDCKVRYPFTGPFIGRPSIPPLPDEV